MKNKNYKKRYRNGIITTIIIIALMILAVCCVYIIATLPLNEFLIMILTILCCFFAISILPRLLFDLQFVIYDYLNRNIDIVEKHLSNDFTEVFLNTDCLKKSAFPLHNQRMYKAKLDEDCNITLRIENMYDSSDVLEKTLSDYSWFLSMFRFEK